MEKEESLTLEISGFPLQCNKKFLIENSDYFKAMLTGDFVEKHKSVIVLNGIALESMQLLLKLQRDHEYIIDDKDIFGVLEASCMLQFLKVKEICIERLEQRLNCNNCLKIWFFTEHLDITRIALKAKLLALMGFRNVKQCDYFNELTLGEIVIYLGNSNLQCFNEDEVLGAALSWFENFEGKSHNSLLKLLFCINFNFIHEFDTILSNSQIRAFEQIIKILEFVFSVRNNQEVSFDEDIKFYGKQLLQADVRNFTGFPCLFGNFLQKEVTRSDSKEVLIYDKFQRKRIGRVLGNHNGSCIVSLDSFHIIKQLDIDSPTCLLTLDGFSVFGHKDKLYIFGGEYIIGRGAWNYHFYIYDVINEYWRIEKLPFPRRHFQTLSDGKYLFVICGTGNYRIIQSNIFWYEIENGKWSAQIELPCSGIQIKSCIFETDLFIFDLNNRMSYRLNTETKQWKSLKMQYFSTHQCLEELQIFSYKNHLYFLDTQLMQYSIQNDELIVSRFIELPDEMFKMNLRKISSVLPKNILCILCSKNKEDSFEVTYGLIYFNMDSFQIQHFQELASHFYAKGTKMQLFNMFHLHGFKGNDFINKFCLQIQ